MNSLFMYRGQCAIHFIVDMQLLLIAVCLVRASTTVLAAQDWWKTAIFYQIYPRSFMDSDDNGVGDIKGITSKVDYLKDIGVNAVWLSPIYTSPMADFGYDIANFTDVDPTFGNMADLKELVQALKERGMKIILDYVPNHSSDEHPWFSRSVNKEGNYTDYYIWRDQNGTYANGTTPKEPNNWQSVFSGSAWQWNSVRQQFYLHQFVVKQPDLNYRNPNVVQEMKDAMEFWLDLGVDGFRVDAIKHLIEDENFPDEPLIDSTAGLFYDNLDHIYTTNQPETLNIIKGWSDLIKEKNKDGNSRIMFLEVYNSLSLMGQYFGDSDAYFTMPFNFHLLEAVSEGMTATDLVTNVNEWLSILPSYGTANWVVGNHDGSRVANRAGFEMVDSVNMILAMLPGIMITYNGDEFGMTDTYLRYDETVDPSGLLLGADNYRSGSRDPERTPLQWDSSLNAGFSKNKTWLPVNPNYWRLNVEAQNKAARSHLKVYKSLSLLRQTATFLSEATQYSINAHDNYTLVIERSSSEGETYMLIVNLASAITTTVHNVNGVQTMTVYTSSVNADYAEGDTVTLSEGVRLRPKAAVILRTGSGATSSASTLSATLISLSSLFYLTYRVV